MELRVDGATVIVPEGATVLDACDLAGRYVPRLCSYPGLAGNTDRVDAERCGLCVVRVAGNEFSGCFEGEREADPIEALACSITARPGMDVVTDDAGLRALRLDILARLLSRHPHICLTCPDRDGCTREECTFGIPIEARCCHEFGRCEFGKVVAHVDSGVEVPRRAVTVDRGAAVEGRIRREPGLCVGCGRCLAVCSTSAVAGSALRSVDGVAMPKEATLKASGCTFCGQCVMVCPAGAFTAPGDAGARWLKARRQKSDLRLGMLPPEAWRSLNQQELAGVPAVAGVFVLADDAGTVVRIGGVADLSRGIVGAMAEPVCSSATHFRCEAAPLFTQRESELLAIFVQKEGHLPPGNDLGDDLFWGDD